MMTSTELQRGRALAAWLAIALTSCVSLGGPSAPIRYWILDALPGPPATTDVERIVGVGPIALPAHLDRPNVITRVGESQLFVSQHDQWAEALAVGVQRVIAENLEVLSPGVKTIAYPWSGPASPEIQVAVNVTRLDARPGDRVQLLAAWLLKRVADRQDLERGSSWIEEPVADESTAEVVAAMSRAVEKLSRELAAAVDRTASAAP